MVTLWPVLLVPRRLLCKAMVFDARSNNRRCNINSNHNLRRVSHLRSLQLRSRNRSLSMLALLTASIFMDTLLLNNRDSPLSSNITTAPRRPVDTISNLA